MSDLRGKRVLVTGAAGGIGTPLVKMLQERGASVIAHARSEAQLAPLGRDVEHVVADLTSLAEAKELADVDADIVIHNAGIGFGADRKKRETSQDGYERIFAVNFLAPFAINERLGPRTKTVIAVASAGQSPPDLEGDPMMEKSYDGVRAYGRSKLALIMDTFDRARRDPSRRYAALHPGTFLATKMVKEAGISPLGTAESGAEAVMFVTLGLLDGDIASGSYWNVKSEARVDESAYDVARQARLRELALGWTR